MPIPGPSYLTQSLTAASWSAVVGSMSVTFFACTMYMSSDHECLHSLKGPDPAFCFSCRDLWLHPLGSRDRLFRIKPCRWQKVLQQTTRVIHV
jgi:hypothetical protein